MWARAPGFSPTFEAFRIEGRWGGLLRAEWERQPHQGFGPTTTTALSLRLVGIDDDRFLDPGQYEPVGVAELAFERGVTTRANGWRLAAAGSLGFGLVFDREELAPLGRERDQFYYRATLEGTARRRLGQGKWLVGGRAFVGVAGWDAAAPLQRQMFVANPDPFGQLNNPFVRSVGALMVGDDMAYHAPGGGNVRGADFRVAAPGLAALNGELEFEARRKPRTRIFNRLAFAGFARRGAGIRGRQRAAVVGTGEVRGRRGRGRARVAPDRRHAVRDPARLSAVPERAGVRPQRLRARRAVRLPVGVQRAGGVLRTRRSPHEAD